MQRAFHRKVESPLFLVAHGQILLNPSSAVTWPAARAGKRGLLATGTSQGGEARDLLADQFAAAGRAVEFDLGLAESDQFFKLFKTFFTDKFVDWHGFTLRIGFA